MIDLSSSAVPQDTPDKAFQLFAHFIGRGGPTYYFGPDTSCSNTVFSTGFYSTNSFASMDCSGQVLSSYGDRFGVCILSDSGLSSLRYFIDLVSCEQVQMVTFSSSDCSGEVSSTSYLSINNFISATGYQIGLPGVCSNGITSFCSATKPSDVSNPFVGEVIYSNAGAASGCSSSSLVGFINEKTNVCFNSHNGAVNSYKFIQESIIG